MYFLRSTRPATISPIWGCMSGSPPGILTTGAPHSSTALKHSSGERFFFRMCAGYWILPPGARQIAAEQRFQNEDERVALASGDLLLQDVRCPRPHLRDWSCHSCLQTIL